MQPRLRRGSGSKDQAMKVFTKTLVEKIDEILLSFSNAYRKSRNIFVSIFWIQRLNGARQTALEKLNKSVSETDINNCFLSFFIDNNSKTIRIVIKIKFQS